MTANTTAKASERNMKPQPEQSPSTLHQTIRFLSCPLHNSKSLFQFFDICGQGQSLVIRRLILPGDPVQMLFRQLKHACCL